MAQSEGNGPIVQLQQALLDDPEFMQQLVQRTLQTLLDQEFTDFLGAARCERNGRRRG